MNIADNSNDSAWLGILKAHLLKLIFFCILVNYIEMEKWDIAAQNKSHVFVFEPVCEKTNNLGSDQVLHKPGCTVKEDGLRLEILDIESREIVLSV